MQVKLIDFSQAPPIHVFLFIEFSQLARSCIEVIIEEEFTAPLHAPHAIHNDCSLIPIYYFNVYVGLQLHAFADHFWRLVDDVGTKEPT